MAHPSFSDSRFPSESPRRHHQRIILSSSSQRDQTWTWLSPPSSADIDHQLARNVRIRNVKTMAEAREDVIAADAALRAKWAGR